MVLFVESRAKKGKNWEEADFYDSDEDTFLDRTGDIEKKRQKRIMRVKPANKTPETYESLVSSEWFRTCFDFVCEQIVISLLTLLHLRFYCG